MHIRTCHAKHYGVFSVFRKLSWNWKKSAFVCSGLRYVQKKFCMQFFKNVCLTQNSFCDSKNRFFGKNSTLKKVLLSPSKNAGNKVSVYLNCMISIFVNKIFVKLWRYTEFYAEKMRKFFLKYRWLHSCKKIEVWLIRIFTDLVHGIVWLAFSVYWGQLGSGHSLPCTNFVSVNGERIFHFA